MEVPYRLCPCRLGRRIRHPSFNIRNSNSNCCNLPCPVSSSSNKEVSPLPFKCLESERRANPSLLGRISFLAASHIKSSSPLDNHLFPRWPSQSMKLNRWQILPAAIASNFAICSSGNKCNSNSIDSSTSSRRKISRGKKGRIWTDPRRWSTPIRSNSPCSNSKGHNSGIHCPHPQLGRIRPHPGRRCLCR